MDVMLYCLIFIQVGIFFTAGFIAISSILTALRQQSADSFVRLGRVRGLRSGSPRAAWHGAR